MATSDYKNALTRMRNYTLGGGYIAGRTSVKNLNPETGERRQATDALMARSPTVGDTKNIQESMELGDEIKALNKRTYIKGLLRHIYNYKVDIHSHLLKCVSLKISSGTLFCHKIASYIFSHLIHLTRHSPIK